MISLDFAKQFSEEWIESWNSHDLDRIMSHYSEDLEFSGPYVSRISGEASGTLKGKEQVRGYWAKALKLVPDLKFELISTLIGISSIVLCYRNAKGQTNAEVFDFTPDGRVYKSGAHSAI